MYVYIMEYYSTIKKNKIMPSARTQMDLEIILHEVKHKRQISLCYHSYVEY